MKKTIIALIFAGFSFGATAQTKQQMKEELAYIQEMWGKEKKTLVNEALKLSAADAEKFWPIYDAYQVERQAYGQKRMEVIMMYADNYETMTNEKAKEIGEMTMKNNQDFDKLQTKYFKKVSKSISPIKAVQFFQIENYIDTQIKAALTDNVPFFPDVKKN
ncbi:MAG: hypothetical protein MUF29_00520 [Chitinophagaceae bacterium]|jgi:hypothetical protein|nr:hypothetical protein [Chitinophagaceae bacterium]